jgi:predicted porin
MPLRSRSLLTVAALASLSATAAQAQSNVTLYGSIDQYLNYMKSSSGASVRAMEDGALLRSRIGFRGTEDLGNGYAAKFTLENGFATDTGVQADSTRLFDRQAWVGLASPFGEVRFGRQNGSTFVRGGMVDFTTRTLGSMVNNFGVPSRFDNDIAYLSPKLFGALQFDVHYALAEQSPAAGGNRQSVFQAGADYTVGPFAAAITTLRAKPANGAAVNKSVFYDMGLVNWNYGPGKVYLTYVRSNNSTRSQVGTSGTYINNGGTLLGNVGGVVAGSDNATTGAVAADAYRTYNIWQISADYQVTQQLRLGALIGRINDQGSANDASGGAVGAYYDLSKRTTFYGLWDTLRNKGTAGFRPSGSAGLRSGFTAANDVNGRTINGFQAGVVHRF